MRKFRQNLSRCIATAIALCSVNIAVGAVSDTPLGQKTMSKFMVSLARYITWPDSSFSTPDTPFKYCLLGENKLNSSLKERLGSKKIKKRGFEITQLNLNAIEESKNCHVVYISVKQATEARPIIEALSGLPILTTGDVENFAAHGGMVGFFGKGKKVALQINKKRLETANLKASSKLFRVSTF